MILVGGRGQHVFLSGGFDDYGQRDLAVAGVGNKDRLQFNRISRETRGGTLIVYADPIWPKVQTQVLTFTALTRVQAARTAGFPGGSLGRRGGLD